MRHFSWQVLLYHLYPELVSETYVQEHLRVAGYRRGREPRLRVRDGPVHAVALGVHVADPELRQGVPLGRGLAQPCEDGVEVPRDHFAQSVLAGQGQLRLGLPEAGGRVQVPHVVVVVLLHVLAAAVHLRQLPVGPGTSELRGPLVPLQGLVYVLGHLLARLVEVRQREAGVRVAVGGVLSQVRTQRDLSVLILFRSASASLSPCLAAWFRNFFALGTFLFTYLPS